MKTLSQTINYVVWHFIKMVGFDVFTYNIVTSSGVLYCGGEDCKDEEECDCEEDCKDSKDCEE